MNATNRGYGMKGYKLTNSLTYGTQRFNAAFTRAL